MFLLNYELWNIVNISWSFICVMMWLKVSLCLTDYHIIKPYWGGGGIAPRILDLGVRRRWVVSFTPRPHYPQYPLDRRLGEPQSRSGRVISSTKIRKLPLCVNSSVQTCNFFAGRVVIEKETALFLSWCCHCFTAYTRGDQMMRLHGRMLNILMKLLSLFRVSYKKYLHAFAIGWKL
jgi:hypothetical protein